MDRNERVGAQVTKLYEAHAADAFRFALHLTGRREDAEDVVQHVFLQAYAVLEEGRELVNPRAWLLKSTKHRSLNLIRDRRDTPAAIVEPPAPFAPDESETEALAQVRAALWSLPEPQHQAFVLRHWSGLSQDEIADVLATTPGAVESLLVRARATLVAEREQGDTECAGVRGRLARMLAPTPAQSAHMAGCRRCRTAQTRLLRAAEFAATFALVPGPHVLHSLSAAIPGFGASGAVASASATGAAAGTGSGGAAVSAVSAATKAGILTKVAVVATTAAVAVTAVHPLRTAVAHEIFHHGHAMTAAASRTRDAARSGGAAARADAFAPVAVGPGFPTPQGADPPAADGGNGDPAGRPNDPPGTAGGDKGEAGTAGSNGDGTGNGGGNGQANGGGAGGTHGKSTTAPGHTGATGPGQANGAGTGKAHGAATGNGAKPAGGAGSVKPTTTRSNQGGGSGATAPPAGSTSNGSGAGHGNAGGNGNGAAGGNAGGNGKGNGKP